MWQPVAVVEPPLLEPVGLDEAKEFLRLDPDDSEPDQQLTGFIAAARQQVENLTNINIAQQTVAVAAASFAALARLPVGPVRTVESISYRDRTGAAVPVAPERYEVFGVAPAVGVRPAYGQAWPSDVAMLPDAVQMRVRVGYEIVPQPLILAMLLMVGDMFAFRETAVVGAVAAQMPSSIQIDRLLANYRRWS